MFLVFCCCSNTGWRDSTGLGQSQPSHRCGATVYNNIPHDHKYSAPNYLILIFWFILILWYIFLKIYYFLTCFGIYHNGHVQIIWHIFTAHVQTVSCSNYISLNIILWTMYSGTSLNKGHIGTRSFVFIYRGFLYSEVKNCTGIIGIGVSRFVLYRERCSLFRVFFIRVSTVLMSFCTAITTFWLCHTHSPSFVPFNYKTSI